MIRNFITIMLALSAWAAAAADYIALRGEASAAAPGNTMAAFRAAWRGGADGVSCEVRLSRDGKLVLSRDDDLQNLTGRAVKVSRSTWKELSALDLGGARLALLEELLAELPEGGRVVIVLAADSRPLADAVGKVVSGSGLGDDQVILASGYEGMVKRAVEVVPYCRTLLVASGAGDGKKLAVAAKKAFADGLMLPGAAWPQEAVAVWRQAGLTLAAVGVDKAADAAVAVRNGAQLILSERAGALKKEAGS